VEIRKQSFFILPAIKFLLEFNPMSGMVGDFMYPNAIQNCKCFVSIPTS